MEPATKDQEVSTAHANWDTQEMLVIVISYFTYPVTMILGYLGVVNFNV